MVQREVGERLAAKPGTSAYGAPSVLAQLSCEVRVLRRVARTVFHPVPNVDSVLVVLRRRGAARGRRPCATSCTRRSRTGARRWPARSRSRRTRRPACATARGRRWSRSGIPRTCAPSALSADDFRALAEALASDRTLVTRAPGKINLCLYLGPPRDDGKHELVSVVQSVSLADDVQLELDADARRDEVVCPGVEGANLALAALDAFRVRRAGTLGPCG